MKFAICECKECKDIEHSGYDGGFLIKFYGDVPPYHLQCPVCGSNRIKVRWIDHD